MRNTLPIYTQKRHGLQPAAVSVVFQAIEQTSKGNSTVISLIGKWMIFNIDLLRASHTKPTWLISFPQHQILLDQKKKGGAQLLQTFIRDFFFFWRCFWFIYLAFVTNKPDTFTCKGFAPFHHPAFLFLYCWLSFSQLFLVFFSVCFTWWYMAQLTWTFCLPFRSPFQTWLRTVLLPLQQGKAARWAHQDLQSSISGWFQFKLRRALPYNRKQKNSSFLSTSISIIPNAPVIPQHLSG